MSDGTFTQLPNGWLEALYGADFSNSEFRVLLFIIRQTVGFHRNSCTLTGSFISGKTKLTERSVWKSLSTLKTRGLITTTPSLRGNVISVNSDYFTSERIGSDNSFRSERTFSESLNSCSVQHLNECSEIKRKRLNTSIKKASSSIVDLFNAICVDLPRVTKLTDARRKAIYRAEKELDGDFENFFKLVHQSDFLCGRSGGNWRANFDWCLQPKNMVKILSRNYSNRMNTAQSSIPTNADYETGF